jgi:hypothetical protein
MKKWRELKSDEKAAVMLAQKLIMKDGATLAELETMMKVEEFLESRNLNSYDYNLNNKKSFNELLPKELKEFLL